VEAASAEGQVERLLEPHRYGKLAVDFRYDEKANTAGDIDLVDYH
jgi:hypothetical protein